MKRFVLKIAIMVFVVYGIIIGINYMVDPANLVHEDVVDSMSNALLEGHIIENSGDYNEGLLQKEMILSMKTTPSTVIIGSSHIMYTPWEFDDYYVAGLSGAYIGDYYALVGLLNEADKIPSKIIFGVDAWAFMRPYDKGRHESISEYAIKMRTTVLDEEQHVQPKNNSRWSELLSISYFQSSLKRLYSNKDISVQDIRKIQLSDNEEIGENAKILPNGRRIFGKKNFQSTDMIDTNIQDMINSGVTYQLGTEMRTVDKSIFTTFEELVNYLVSEDIEVKLYLPSFHPRVYGYMVESEKYDGVVELEDMIRDYAEKEHITVHGSFDPQRCGVTEEDFADMFHLYPDKALENFHEQL